MADFSVAFERMIANEGGYKLHTISGDTGGQTYAGIARNANPNWEGWRNIDAGEVPDKAMVSLFYLSNYWKPVKGDEIVSQEIANSVFDFAVNAGTGMARRIAQIAIQVTPDGLFGPVTIAAINAINPEIFVLRYALAKIARYRDIVTKNRAQIKFMLGWINRTLKGVA